MKAIHEHVMGLHQTLFSNIDEEDLKVLLASEEQCQASSASEPRSAWASHTLAWKAIDAQRAVWLVGQLKDANIQVDRYAHLFLVVL